MKKLLTIAAASVALLAAGCGGGASNGTTQPAHQMTHAQAWSIIDVAVHDSLQSAQVNLSDPAHESHADFQKDAAADVLVVKSVAKSAEPKDVQYALHTIHELQSTF